MSRPDETMIPPDGNHAAGANRPLPQELQSIEAALAKLRPREDRLDRERLAFLAGQASMMGRDGVLFVTKSRRSWAWPSAFGAMSAVSAVLLLMVLRLSDRDEVPSAAFADGGFATAIELDRQAPDEPAPGDGLPPLMVKDAYREDAAWFVFSGNVAPMGVSAASTAWPSDEAITERPPLTPAAWWRVLDDVGAFHKSSVPL